MVLVPWYISMLHPNLNGPFTTTTKVLVECPRALSTFWMIEYENPRQNCLSHSAEMIFRPRKNKQNNEKLTKSELKILQDILLGLKKNQKERWVLSVEDQYGGTMPAIV